MEDLVRLYWRLCAFALCYRRRGRMSDIRFGPAHRSYYEGMETGTLEAAEMLRAHMGWTEADIGREPKGDETDE